MAEALFAIAHRDDALAVAVPCDVVDAAGDDVVLAFGCAVAFAVPDADGAGDIAAGDIETGG